MDMTETMINRIVDMVGDDDPEMVERIMNGDDGLGSTAVCSLTGITYRMLDYWCRTGRISPDVVAHGSGTRREFGFDALVEIAELLQPCPACGCDSIQHKTEMRERTVFHREDPRLLGRHRNDSTLLSAIG